MNNFEQKLHNLNETIKNLVSDSFVSTSMTSSSSSLTSSSSSSSYWYSTYWSLTQKSRNSQTPYRFQDLYWIKNKHTESTIESNEHLVINELNSDYTKN